MKSIDLLVWKTWRRASKTPEHNNKKNIEDSEKMMPYSLLSSFIFSTKLACRKLLVPRYISFTPTLNASKSTVDPEEVKKFNSTANEWWEGYGMLHSFNSLRVPLIRDGLLSTYKHQNVSNPLKGYKILDVGCGGGILSEPLARLGANVTGLDPGPQNIQVAAEHASKDQEIKGRLNYICDTVENLAILDTKYDAIACSEVIEHVSDVQSFVNSCVELTKVGGSLFFTTFNRTNLSYIMTIVMAEYVLGIIPRGTHEWNKFVKPEDLSKILELLNCTTMSVEGIMYNPITKHFSWCTNSANWYALHAVKH